MPARISSIEARERVSKSDKGQVSFILRALAINSIGANSGALMTFASGIPTLMIGTSAEIPYVHFLMVSAPLALLSAPLAFFVIKFFHRHTLATGGEEVLAERATKVAAFDEWALVKDRSLFYRAAIILGLTIIGFAFAQTLGVGLDYIAFCGGIAALLFSGSPPEQAIGKVKWPIILFFIGLFVLSGTVQDTGLLTLLAGGIYDLADGELNIVIAILTPFVFLTAGIVDNIPVAATMIPVVKTMIASGIEAEPLWWTLIAAGNLGGNPTPVGSIAAVIALHALERIKPNDAELTASMHDFEAALTARRSGLQVPRLEVMLVVIDDSNQTDMALGLALELAERNTGGLLCTSVLPTPVPPQPFAKMLLRTGWRRWWPRE